MSLEALVRYARARPRKWPIMGRRDVRVWGGTVAEGAMLRVQTAGGGVMGHQAPLLHRLPMPARGPPELTSVCFHCSWAHTGGPLSSTEEEDMPNYRDVGVRSIVDQRCVCLLPAACAAALLPRNLRATSMPSCCSCPAQLSPAQATHAAKAAAVVGLLWMRLALHMQHDTRQQARI